MGKSALLRFVTMAIFFLGLSGTQDAIALPPGYHSLPGEGFYYTPTDTEIASSDRGRALLSEIEQRHQVVLDNCHDYEWSNGERLPCSQRELRRWENILRGLNVSGMVLFHRYPREAVDYSANILRRVRVSFRSEDNSEIRRKLSFVAQSLHRSERYIETVQRIEEMYRVHLNSCFRIGTCSDSDLLRVERILARVGAIGYGYGCDSETGIYFDDHFNDESDGCRPPLSLDWGASDREIERFLRRRANRARARGRRE